MTGAGTLMVTSQNDDYYGTTVIGAGSTLQLGLSGAAANLGTGKVLNSGTLAFQFASGLVVELNNQLSGSGETNYLPSLGAGGSLCSEVRNARSKQLEWRHNALRRGNLRPEQ